MKDMSLFHKIVQVISALCALAYAVILICYLAGLLPSVYEISAAQTLLGICWLGQAILNWKSRRVLAITNMVTALMAFATAILAYFLK